MIFKFMCKGLTRHYGASQYAQLMDRDTRWVK